MTRLAVRDFGTALRMNSANTTSVTVSGSTPTVTSGLTICLWVNPDLAISKTTTNATYRIIRTTDDNIDLFTRQNTANIEFKLNSTQGSSPRLLISERWLIPHVWNFVVIQYNAATGAQEGYINSTLRGSNTKDGTNIICNNAWIIGDPTVAFAGMVDEVAVFSYAFTQAQRDAAYYQGIYPTTSQVFYYKFDEGSGTSATDYSNNAKTGTIANGIYTTDVVMKARSVAGVRPLAAKFTGAASSSPDINSHNGITTDPNTTNYFGFDTPAIRKYDPNWNLVTENNLAASQAGVAHLGDGQYWNGFLYVPGENYTSPVQYDHQRICKYRASDLSLVETSDISAPGGNPANAHECSGLTIDGVAGIIYISSYVQSDKIFKYNLADYSYLGYIQLSRNLPLTQGITYRNGVFYIAEDTTKRVWRVDKAGRVNEYFRVQSSSGGGQEGLDWTGANMLVLDENSGTSQSIIRICPPVFTRQSLGGNTVYNGDFSKKPENNNAATTADNRYVDGTTGGTAVNFAADSYYGWATNNGADASSAQFVTRNGVDCMQILSVTAGKSMEVAPYRDDTNFDHIRYGAPIQPGVTSYTVNYTLETELISGDCNDGVFMAVRQFASDGSNVSTTTSTKIKVTSGVQTYSFTFTPGSAAAYYAPRMSLVGNTGAATLNIKAWFSNVTIKPTTPLTRTVA